MKTTGIYSQKRYKCTRCGLIQTHGTNHWGSIYPSCSGCSWKNPLSPQTTMVCMEKMPKGYKKPEEWTSVKLGDIATIKKLKVLLKK